MKKPPAPRRSTAPKADRRAMQQGRKPHPPRRPGAAEPTPPTTDNTERLIKIAGLPAVAALFKRDPHRVQRLYYDEPMKTVAGAFCAQLARLHRPYRMVDAAELTRIAGTPLHGGILAAAVPKPVPELDFNTVRQWARDGKPLLILDGVSNPHNLGAIARTLAFFGLKHLVISDHPAQAGLSDAAHRVAEGGFEYLDIRRAPRLAQYIARLKEHYRVVGTALSHRAVSLADLPQRGRPLALVLGNEENGLSPETLAACDAVVTIPGSGWVQSLNVSATAAILVYEMVARRGKGKNLG